MKPNQAIIFTITVAIVQEWIERDATSMKHWVTQIGIADYIVNRKSNDSDMDQNELLNGPSQQRLHHYVAWYQQSAQDYFPIDVESIRWLIGQSSTIQFLSLDDTGSFNGTIQLLEALRHSINSGQRAFGDGELKNIPLFAKMEWMRNFETPPPIMHCWSVIDRFLHDIQSTVPKTNPVFIDKWFSVVHSFWALLLRQATNHLFFRRFRRSEDIPRFQHSVRWTMFFYMFQTTEDTPEMVTIKEMIISDASFRKGIRDFIETVEMALNEIKPLEFSRMNVSSIEVLNDAALHAEISLILAAMNLDEWYQRWWSELFIDSCDRWIRILLDAFDGNLDVNVRKEILASSMLWDLETLVAYIEPTFFERVHLHQVLLTMRSKMRRNVFGLILSESWF